MNDSALVVAVLAVMAIYFLPSFLAFMRAVPNRGSVVVVNLFLGWTLLGWVASLAMASRSRHPEISAPRS